jgi:hypothetical protein
MRRAGIIAVFDRRRESIATRHRLQLQVPARNVNNYTSFLIMSNCVGQQHVACLACGLVLWDFG